MGVGTVAIIARAATPESIWFGGIAEQV